MNVERYVRDKVKPIFDKVLQETSKNRVSVGECGFRGFYVFYQPHNCRVYFDYVKPVKPTFGGSVVVKNSSELMFKELFGGCRVTIKKNCVELINMVDVDKRFVVRLKSARDDIVKVLVGKISQTSSVLKLLINRFGGSSSFQIINFSVQDNKFEHESFIDSIGVKGKFRNEVLKKVYDERNVEFSDPSFAVNYLTNQAALMGDFDIVRWCEQNICVLDDVFKLESVFVSMSFDYRLFVSNFLFNRFGGVC